MIGFIAILVSAKLYCDSHNYCNDDQTCCQQNQAGNWGCCPYKTGICCSDKIHCCPIQYSQCMQGGKCALPYFLGLSEPIKASLVLPTVLNGLEKWGNCLDGIESCQRNLGVGVFSLQVKQCLKGAPRQYCQQVDWKAWYRRQRYVWWRMIQVQGLEEGKEVLRETLIGSRKIKEEIIQNGPVVGSKNNKLYLIIGWTQESWEILGPDHSFLPLDEEMGTVLKFRD